MLRATAVLILLSLWAAVAMPSKAAPICDGADINPKLSSVSRSHCPDHLPKWTTRRTPYKWGTLYTYVDKYYRLSRLVCLYSHEHSISVNMTSDGDVQINPWYATVIHWPTKSFFVVNRSGIFKASLTIDMNGEFLNDGGKLGNDIVVLTSDGRHLLAGCNLNSRRQMSISIVSRTDDLTGVRCNRLLRRAFPIERMDECTFGRLAGFECTVDDRLLILDAGNKDKFKRPILAIEGALRTFVPPRAVNRAQSLDAGRSLYSVIYTGSLPFDAGPQEVSDRAPNEVYDAYVRIKELTGTRPIILASSFGAILLKQILSSNDPIDLVLVAPTPGWHGPPSRRKRIEQLRQGFIETEESDIYERQIDQGPFEWLCQRQAVTRVLLIYSKRDEMVGDVSEYVRKVMGGAHCPSVKMKLIRQDVPHGSVTIDDSARLIIQGFDDVGLNNGTESRSSR